MRTMLDQRNPELPPAMAADMLGSMKDGVLAVDPTGAILLANPVALAMFELEATKVIGATFAEVFLTRDGLDAFNDCMLAAIYNPGVPQTQELVLSPGGEERFIIVRTNRLTSQADGSGIDGDTARSTGRSTEGVVAVISDISERVRRLRDKVESEQQRAAAGRFIVAIFTVFSLFTLTLEPMQAFARAGGLDIGPLIGLLALVLTAVGIMWWTHLPPARLGLTWHLPRRDLAESIFWSIGFCVFITLGKLFVLRVLLGISADERALFEFWVLDNGEVVTSASLMALGIAFYIVTTPIQEIGARSAIQAPLQTFLDGAVRSPRWTANIVTTLMFAVLHAHLDPVVALMVTVPSLLWGWLFMRSGTILSPIISHTIIGIYAVFVLGLFVGFDNQ
ncbi:MAG: CPBP family intramembrane metalloprotease [Chromatiaceae bacterium]|nr:CPBP family intramembrane metalloprotease [Chromatiaceae bacterium]MCF7994329.1 CPBP family intramembrane metalloprotease [Chromatiaceae bacterium]